MIRNLVAVAAIALTSSFLHAQAPPRDPTQLLAPGGTGLISGVVVDADNKPMRLVAVRIEGDPRASRTVLTDDAGRFAFSKLPAGEFFVRAKKAAYPEVSYGAKRPGRAGVRLQIKDGVRFENIALRMERGAVLTGTVINERGQAVPDVSVSAYRVYTALDGTFSTSSVLSGSTYPRTDDRGAFRFYGLPAGEYIVGTSPFFGSGSSARVPSDEEMREAFARAQQAVQPGAAAAPKPQGPPPQQVDYTPVYYPDAPNPIGAARIRVSAGEERAGLDLRLTLRPTAAISGQITNLPAGGPGAVELLLVTRAQGSTLHTGADPDGSFNFKGLAAGDYTVAARTSGANMLIASYDVVLNGRDVSGINLILAPPISVTGRVVFQDTAAPPPFSQVRISNNPTSRSGYGVSVSATPDASGAFALQGMLPGTYQVGTQIIGVSGSAPTFTVVSVALGSRDITDVGADFVAGAAMDPITITLSANVSELSGQLITADGKPGTDYYVVAVAADQRYWILSSRRIKSTRPDANGRFVFAGLPAGTYRLAATTDLENSDLSDRTFLEQILAASAEVTVLQGEKKVFDLKIGGF